jgi:S-adenosylmethionine-dependent methyltransferase
MTVAERLKSLRVVWEMLPAGGLLVIVETPNRLWYRDTHTAMLPYFHWLPDELAFAYSRFSPRRNFQELYRDFDEASKDHFLRRGRGVSFHEFEIAIKPVPRLNVVSSLSTFQGVRYKLKRSKRDRKYKSLIADIRPDIHEGFFDENLDLIIRKTDDVL